MGLLRRIFTGQARHAAPAPAGTSAPVAPTWKAVSPDPDGAEWITSGEWRTWDAPLSIVAGESHHLTELRSIAGPPRAGGWLVPVEATLEREPENRYDPAAIVVRIGDLVVGYIDGDLSEDLAGDLDRRGPHVRIRGIPALVRGGWPDKPNLGVMLWINHPEVSEVFPSLDFDELGEDYGAPRWPPRADEGEPVVGSSPQPGGKARRDPVVRCADPRLPPLKAHFTDYVEDVREWKRRGSLDEATLLLTALMDATEAESRQDGSGVSPWAYEQLAIVHRRQHDTARETTVLERFAGQVHAPGAGPAKLLERLRRLRVGGSTSEAA